MNNEKYEILLSELAEVIKRKNREIERQEHAIRVLIAKIEAAERSAK